MNRTRRQHGYILMPVIIAIVLIATIAFMLNNQSTINVDETGDMLAVEQVENITRAALAHATWGAQNSGCAGDMSMTTVPFGQSSTGSYTAAVTTPGGGTTAYPDLAADQDAWFRSDDPTKNNGTTADLHLRMESGNLEYALYRFDLSSLPAGSQINSATAWLYVATGGPGGGVFPEGALTVHRVTTDWTETGATWDTMNTNYDSVVIATIPAQPQDGVWVQINLTAQVQAWMNGGEANYGIMLIPTAEGTHGKLASREATASEQPRLDVIVGTGPATPMTITATGTLTGNPSPANDITRTLIRTNVPAYQPPGSITLQLGTNPGADAMLDSFYPRNYGASDFVQVNGSPSWLQRPLFRFDLDGVPARAYVLSAQLELRMRSLNTAGTATIHQVTHSWVEGTKDGTGQPDGASWATYDGNNSWTSTGGDFNASAVAETAINGGETWVTWEIAPLVNQWLAGEPNYGLLIQADAVLREAEFSTREDTDPTVHPKLTITYVCECGSTCQAPQGSGSILMVVSDSSWMTPEEIKKIALFESWGYSVTPISQWDVDWNFDTLAASSDVVYVSEGVDPTTWGMAPKLAATPLAVINEEGALNDDLGIASGFASPVGPAINVTDTSHYITALFPTGPLDIYSAGMEQLTVSGTEAAGLQPLANTGGAGSLVVLDKGAALAGGGTAAGRRVMLPLGTEAKTNWDYLNGNGRLIVQRALQWGTGNTAVTPAGNLLMVVGNGASPAASDVARKTLMESWGYTVDVIDDGITQADLQAAALAADVTYVTGTIGGGTLADKLSGVAAPIVNEFSGKIDNFGFASSASTTATDSGFAATEPSHYITEPFGGSAVTVFNSTLSMPVLGGTLAAGLDMVAFVVSGNKMIAVATLDTGAIRWDGNPAPARRAHLPFSNADTTDMTVDGQTILQRSLEWAAGASVVATTAPIAHWKLDETSGVTAVDSAGGHDGTLNNFSALAWGSGQIDGALDFDGTNDAIRVSHADTLSLTETMTFIAWINASSFGSTYQTIVAKDGGGGGSNYWFGTWQQELDFGFYAGGFYREVFTGGLNLQPGTWYQLAATFDNATDEVRLYVDGSEVHSGTLAFSPTAIAADLAIGRSPDGEYWRGLLDDVRIYDSVLPASEINDLFAAGSGGGGGGGEPPPTGCDGTFRDEFNAQSFDGSDGTLPWAGSWQEIGESDGPTSGDTRVTADQSNFQLRTRDNNNGGEGVEREADLSSAATATLSYDYRRSGLDNSNDYTSVEISANGAAGPWTELTRYQGGGTDSAYIPASHAISSYISNNTRIRFKTSANMGGSDIVWFDNIQITCTP